MNHLFFNILNFDLFMQRNLKEMRITISLYQQASLQFEELAACKGETNGVQVWSSCAWTNQAGKKMVAQLFFNVTSPTICSYVTIIVWHVRCGVEFNISTRYTKRIAVSEFMHCFVLFNRELSWHNRIQTNFKNYNRTFKKMILCSMVWDWLILRAGLLSCWPYLLTLFVFQYFLFFSLHYALVVEFRNAHWQSVFTPPSQACTLFFQQY